MEKSLEYINPKSRSSQNDLSSDRNLSKSPDDDRVQNKIISFSIGRVRRIDINGFSTERQKRLTQEKEIFVCLHLIQGDRWYFANENPDLILVALAEKIKTVEQPIKISPLELLAISKEIGIVAAAIADHL